LGRLGQVDLGTVAAFLVGSVALILASIPSASYLTRPLAGLGLSLGLLGGVAPTLWKRANPMFPLAASALCLVVLLVAGGRPRPPAAAPRFVAYSLRDGGMAAHRPLTAGDWVDASTEGVRMGEVKARVVGVRVGGVELDQEGKKLVTPEKHLVIRLQMSLETVLFRQVPYDPWADVPGTPSKHPPTLTDNGEREYPQKTFAPGQRVRGRRDLDALTPGHLVDEVLVFPVPPVNVEYLRLTLPAVAFGETGEFHFQIPRSLIEFSP
jgi:hypothetical protein